MEGVKVVVIGGGSSYTPELADGIIKRYSTFPVRELVLVDIDAGRKKVEIVSNLIRRMFTASGINIPVSYTLNRRSALKGADFVVSQIRVGGLEARARDESIPLKYGIIGQETTGPGGFANALRTIPVVMDICRDMENLCPEAWLINFTNPSGIITEAVLGHSSVRCLGLCNIPINMANTAAGVFGVDRSKVNCRIAGLNHLSFMDSLLIDGNERLQEFIIAVSSEIKAKNISGADIPGDFLGILGLIPTPYLRYYFLEKQTVAEETAKLESTGKTRAGEVMEIEQKLFDIYSNESLVKKPEELSKRGGALYSEAAVELMDSIFNDRKDIQVVNTMNNGCISELPNNAIVETNCIIGRNGAQPLKTGLLPLAVRGLVQQVKAYEQLTIEAAIDGCRDKALLALINNPLVHDVATAKSLLDDILTANKDYLELFFREELRYGLFWGNRRRGKQDPLRYR